MMRPMRQRPLAVIMVSALAFGAVGILLSKPGDAAEKAGAADKSRPATMASALVAIAPDRPVAVVDGKAITAAELDEMVGSKLFNIRQQEYQLRRQALD